MNLTGKQIVEQGIVTGPLRNENIQQHGVDLNLIKVSKLVGTNGFIPLEGKTILARRVIVDPNWDDVGNGDFWLLDKGTYDITLSQGCKIPPNQRAQIIHRSSLFRNGGMLVSALFDAGFETDQIGTQMILTIPLKIQYGARIGQLYVTSSNEVTNLYNGQWQNDKQRDFNDLRDDLTALK